MPSWINLVQVVLQAVASFAIAGSAIYAAVQFRQARRAASVANFSKLVELMMQLRRLRVEDPRLVRVFADDAEQLSSDEEAREHFMNLMHLSLFEIAWFAHQQGQVPDDYLESWVENMRSILREESFRRMWATRTTKILHEDFRRFVEDLMARNELHSPDRARGTLPEPQRDLG